MKGTRGMVKDLLKYLCGVLCAWFSLAVTAAPVDPVDTVNFVTTSLVVASPGEKAYSAFGHAALRMQCPEHQLDYCFSYELPEVGMEVLSFFAGTLNFGMIYAPTDEYCRNYEKEGRTVTEYELNLTDVEKRRLWQLLDERVAEGLVMPCAYLKHGCAIESVRLVDAVLQGEIEYKALPGHLQDATTVRMIVHSGLKAFPWEYFLWNLMAGKDADMVLPMEYRLMVPGDVVAAWQHAVVVDSAGRERPLMTGSSVLVSGTEIHAGGFTPLWVCTLWLSVVVLLTIGQFRYPLRRVARAVDSILMGGTATAGVFILYLWLFSRQDATSWNWYLVPFNPLPLCIWLWGRYHPWSSKARCRIYGGYSVVLCLYLAVSPWLWSVGQPAWMLSVGSMLVRTLHYYRIEKK